MSDNVATRRRQSVADPLREFAQSTEVVPGMSLRRCRDYLLKVADEIDAEHERRMEDCRRNTRRVTCNYFSRVVADYKRGEKWIRKRRGGDE